MIPLLRSFLAENWSALSPDSALPRRLSFLIHATGVSKLVCYVFADDASPRWVAKMTRRPCDNPVLESEYRLVQSLRDHGSDFVRATVPAPLITTHLAGHLVGIESYFPGYPMDGLLFNKRTDGEPAYRKYLDLTVAWLLRSQQETLSLNGRLTQGQIEIYFLSPIRHMKATARLTTREIQYLDQLALRAMALAREPLPLVFCHGDLRPGNVLLEGDSLLVIDWEFGRPLALPLMDVFGLLARTYACLHSLSEIDGYLEDYLQAFEQVFFEPGLFAPVALDYVSRACQALRLDPAWVSVLFAMFLVNEMNCYYSFLTRRAENGCIYLLRRRSGQITDSFSQQLARQKNVWLLGYLADHEENLIFHRLSTVLSPRSMNRGQVLGR